jgi:HK97 gp10 family phage protein
MITLTGLADLLARIPADQAAHDALESAAAALAGGVRDKLETPPPGGPHETPWKQSGALADSITHETDGATAIIGSASPVAAWQECGTGRIPPRPFLAPAAQQSGEAIAHAIGLAVMEAFR